MKSTTYVQEVSNLRYQGQKVRFVDLQSGLYPTVEQVSVLFLVFLARTGWNQSTAEMINIIDKSLWCKSYTEKYIWLYSFKPRSNNWQDTVSITNHKTGAYQIIEKLLQRTEGLRRIIKSDPDSCTNHKITERSAWLYQRTSQCSNTKPIQVEFSSTQLSDVLLKLIKNHNAKVSSDGDLIPEGIVVSDLRDIFSAVTFVNSNFSLYLTQLALGHKSPTTTFNYLRRRAWRIESENKKNAMFVVLIDQIETHRIIDLTQLRAKMDGVDINAEQLERLEKYRKYRTYSGTGCSDPKNPPAHIDPTNPRDGSTYCSQGHLCPGCPKARVFSDSLVYLARRLAELEWLRDTLPLEVFHDSSLSDQYIVLSATLKQWPKEDVSFQVQYWTAQIANGLHRPIRFSGEY
jgi:hypothetical protein